MSFHFNIDDALFTEAAQRLGVARVGGRCDGFGGKSRGEIVEAPGSSRYWLKLVGWIGEGVEALADGETSSLQPVGVAKPTVIRSQEWTRHGTAWRATLMTLAPSPALENTPWRRPGADPVPDIWLQELRNALRALRSSPTNRMLFTPESLKAQLMHHFGDGVPTDATDWAACHGDLNWSNLTAPTLTLLDWENWGLAPRGYDVAWLICCSANDPAMVRRLQAAFSDELNSPTGDVAILAAIATWTGNAGDHLDGVQKRTLAQTAQRILAQPKWLRGKWLGRTAPLLWSRRQWPIASREG